MKKIIKDLHDFEAGIRGSDCVLTRETINEAIAANVLATAKDVYHLLKDDYHEKYKANLIGSLTKNSEFKRNINEGHITFGMVKPHANKASDTGLSDGETCEQILTHIKEPLSVIASRHTFMPYEVAKIFYDHLSSRPDVFENVARFMSSGALTGLIMFSGKDDAIAQWRSQIGATDPKKAAEGTIRRKFSRNMDNNVVHGSDAIETADREIKTFVSLI